MAVPEQIKETTVTKVEIAATTFNVVALAADPDRILLAIHNRAADNWYHAISSTAPGTSATFDNMIKHDGGTESVYFTTHVPVETVYIYNTGSTADFWIEHASRSSTT